MFVNLVGLHVVDPPAYAQYREAMTPILRRYGGDFGCDFVVHEVLRPAGATINRVFTIQFPDAATKDAFFGDPDYLAVRARHFEGAVDAVHVLAEYTVGG